MLLEASKNNQRSDAAAPEVLEMQRQLEKRDLERERERLKHEEEMAALRAEIDAQRMMAEVKIDNMREEMAASIGEAGTLALSPRVEHVLGGGGGAANGKQVMATEKSYLETLVFNPPEGAAGSANIAMAAAQMMM